MASPLLLADSTMQKMLECPVCLEVGKTPKVLNCGHNICGTCENVMSRQRNQIACPVCRVETVVPVGGLSTNYSLSDLIAHLTQVAAEQRHACGSCPERGTANKMFLCLRCNSVIVCSYCAVKHHSGHQLDELNELIGKRWREISQWRNGVNDRYVEVSTNSARLDAKRLQLTAGLRHLSRFLIEDAVPRVNVIGEESKKAFEAFKTELEAFVAGDSTEANIIGTAAEECAHREQLMNATNDRIKEALDKENRAMAVMQRAEKEIRSILGVVDRPPRPTVTLHQPTTSVAASSSSSNSHNHSHSHGHSHSHSHSHSNHNSNSNSNRTTRMSMNDRFLRLVGVRPSEASSSSYVPTVRPAPSSSSSPSPTRQLTSPVLPQNNRQRSTIRLSLNPVRVIPTPHTSDFSSRSPSPVHLTYRLATPSPIAIDDDSDAADAIRSASVDRDEDDAASNSFISQAPSSVRSPMRVAFDDVSSDSDDTVDLAVTRQQQAEETSSSGQRREQQRKRPRRITVDHHRHQSSSSPFFPADMPSTSQRHRAQPSSRVSRPRRVTSPIASIRYRRGQFAVSSDSD